jgi:hypothetical protein
MLKRLFEKIRFGAAAARTPALTHAGPGPSWSPAVSLYNLLFCDDPTGFMPKPTDDPTDWQQLLFGPAHDPAKIEQLASDQSAESRIRALAFNWLRSHGRPVPKGEVLGVIIEMPLDGGLDVLAAYADGRVRYLNQSGKVGVLEPDGLPEVNQLAKTLIEQSSAVVARLGPWEEPRLPPPTRPNIRISFIVSDGLYFGQGPRSAMEQDPGAAPLIRRGGMIVKLLVERVDSQS